MPPLDVHTADFRLPGVIEDLPRRTAPYWNILRYCRHLGVHKPLRDTFCYWVARVRRKDGNYTQVRLGGISNTGREGLTYHDAVRRAEAWFSEDETVALAAPAFAVGTTTTLSYTSGSDTFTVGDALADYVEWKRLAAAPSHFGVVVSLINHHIVHRLGDIPAAALNGRHIRELSVAILETPPKRGNQPLGPRRNLQDLDPEALRKRKKTLNTVLGVLRLTLRIAWENGAIDSERAWRCIRNLPNFDRPRTVALSRPQCTRLLAACRSDLRLFVQGALYTGCRASELSNLRVRDVGHHVFGIYVAKAKRYRARHVYLPDEGMSFFLKLTSGRDADDFVFLSRHGWPWSKADYKHLFRDAATAAGLTADLVFHGLRHTYASQLIQAGAPLMVVARQLGHATIDTVSRTYGHLAPTSLESEIRSKFAVLDDDEAAQVAARRSELDEIARSLQAQNATIQSGFDVEERSTSWPRSNFYRSRVEILVNSGLAIDSD